MARATAPAATGPTPPLGTEVPEPLGAEPAAAMDGARVAAEPRRALLVDDSAVSRRLLARALEEVGFEVICAADGADALQVVAREILSLDLMVADLFMPNMDGEQLVRTIRRAGGESDLAIVVVSGSLEPGLETKLEREGADAVLRKELGPRFIAQAAGAVLKRKRAARQA